MPDKEIKCVECGEVFLYTEALQKKLQDLFAQGKIEGVSEPKRCQPCRAAKKQAKRSQGN